MTYKWIGNPEFLESSKKNKHINRSGDNFFYDKDEEKITSADLYLHEKHTRVLLDKLYEKRDTTKEVTKSKIS